MAVTIIATAGAVDANSYVTYSDARAYFTTRIDYSAWEDAEGDDQKAALVLATSLLDTAYTWVGVKVSDDQALRWPRSGVVDRDGFPVDSATIPAFLADATAEFALMLLADDRLKDPDTQGFSQIKVGPLYMQVARGDRRRIIPDYVELMLAHYGVTNDTSMRTLERV